MMLYFSGGELLILLLSDRVRGWTDYINPVGEGCTWVSVICEHHLFLVYSCPRVRLLGVLMETEGVYYGLFLVIPGLTFFPQTFQTTENSVYLPSFSAMLLLTGKRANVSKKSTAERWVHLYASFFSQGSGNSSPSYLRSNSVMLSKGCMFVFCLALIYLYFFLVEELICNKTPHHYYLMMHFSVLLLQPVLQSFRQAEPSRRFFFFLQKWSPQWINDECLPRSGGGKRKTHQENGETDRRQSLNRKSIYRMTVGKPQRRNYKQKILFTSLSCVFRVVSSMS